MALPLEDKFNDIVGKAMRGLQMGDSLLAERAGVSATDIQALRNGTWDEATARRIAPHLQLSADALAASGLETYHPEAIALDGFAQFTTPFQDMTVNAYLAWDSETGDAAAFDTGSDCGGLLEALERNELELRAIFLTHTHGDHVFDLDRLKERTGAPAYVCDREIIEGAEPFSPGRTWSIGRLRLESRLTWGHSRGGATYVIRGLARPIAVVGDAIFAGSMGGGGVSYPDALRTNREEILTLPDDTVLAPGHGPLTTVGEEKRHNPFFA